MIPLASGREPTRVKIPHLNQLMTVKEELSRKNHKQELARTVRESLNRVELNRRIHEARLARRSELASRVTTASARQPRLQAEELAENSLLAAALRSEVSLTNFRHLNAQRRDALVAAVYFPKPEARTPGSAKTGSTKARAAEDELGEALLAGVEAWLAEPDHSPKSWRAMLSEVLGPVIEAALTSRAIDLGKIFRVLPEDRENALQAAIEATEDLRLRLLSAEPDEAGFTAAGKWGLKSLLTAAHQKLAAQSIVKHAKDVLEYKTFSRAKREQLFQEGFDGARRFVAGNPEGRHGAIHLQVDETGEGWLLPDREVNGKRLSAKRVMFPGESPEDPNEWSGSKSRVEYRHRSKSGKITWHTA